MNEEKSANQGIHFSEAHIRNDNKCGLVIIGRNEGERLRRCLQSIKLQSEVKAIVYVDSGSSDDSVVLAEQFGALVTILGRPFSAARARNEGFIFLKARYPIIQFVQFVDGDCELVTGWLSTALTFIKSHGDVAVVCGRRRELHPSASVYNLLCDMEWDTPIGQALACGGDALMRAEAFQATGGFRAQLIAGEEPELCLRLRENGWKVWRIDAEMTRHDASLMRFEQWWIRAVRFGYGIVESYAVWRREMMRAMFWGGVLPLLVGFGMLVHSAASFLLLLYPLLIIRIAVRRGLTKIESWIYGLFTTIAKFAELQGILTFYWRRIKNNGNVDAIEYK